MNKLKDKNVKLKTIKVIENSIIFFKDGNKKTYDAIYKTNKGIFTGYILNKKIGKNHHTKFYLNQTDKKLPTHFYIEFVESGFIPDYNIKSIKGGTKKRVYKETFLNKTNRKKQKKI